MEPIELLEQGRAVLDPLLRSHGFAFEPGASGVGSGGPYARGAYVRGAHRLEFSVRWQLGEVVYRVGETSLPHDEFMRAVAGPRQAKYPGFSSNPVDGFRDLRDDLEHHGKAFLRETDEDFHAFARRAAQTKPREGFSRLSDVDAG